MRKLFYSLTFVTRLLTNSHAFRNVVVSADWRHGWRAQKKHGGGRKGSRQGHDEPFLRRVALSLRYQATRHVPVRTATSHMKCIRLCFCSLDLTWIEVGSSHNSPLRLPRRRRSLHMRATRCGMDCRALSSSDPTLFSFKLWPPCLISLK